MRNFDTTTNITLKIVKMKMKIYIAQLALNSIVPKKKETQTLGTQSETRH